MRRRDFTVNAMAKDDDGNIIDLFNGQRHLKWKTLMTPLDPMTTLMDDPLRLLRAIRFSITKGFTIDGAVWNAMFQPKLMDKLEKVVSQERIREEITKMMKHDTVSSIRLLQEIDKRNPRLLEIIFGGNIWLLPSTKK
jgi:tRNA nucleotidyltransferase/poly(A) polymerase